MGVTKLKNPRHLTLSVDVAPVVLVEMTGDIVWPFTVWQEERRLRPRAVVQDSVYAYTAVYEQPIARRVQNWIKRFTKESER